MNQLTFWIYIRNFWGNYNNFNKIRADEYIKMKDNYSKALEVMK